eukprot:CAMPEP_0185338264 /NCGR_PEP_ID=MMETSP1363-20130426/95142_1 /TAXON_ID=38817 /ORGANISM="Gephyrocapsa oceanica, Strain RCC1303" /LENGTH=171 /DNA_ID=CAMNT_0027937435 /DNA_START=463 /DNA_END=979 /DNA_ORIENTATION=-
MAFDVQREIVNHSKAHSVEHSLHRRARHVYAVARVFAAFRVIFHFRSRRSFFAERYVAVPIACDGVGREHAWAIGHEPHEALRLPLHEQPFPAEALLQVDCVGCPDAVVAPNLYIAPPSTWGCGEQQRQHQMDKGVLLAGELLQAFTEAHEGQHREKKLSFLRAKLAGGVN